MYCRVKGDYATGRGLCIIRERDWRDSDYVTQVARFKKWKINKDNPMQGI